MADWKTKVSENKSIVDFWYAKITEAGHGNLTVCVNKDNGTIDIRPELSIRNMEEQRVYKQI
ncbi:MAG: hypothetical protein KKH94_11440 [Candidatus Omnitrophica bacterium]|nr:hypothetical protein [Candidatus Omnitrophota bacterium]